MLVIVLLLCGANMKFLLCEYVMHSRKEWSDIGKNSAISHFNNHEKQFMGLTPLE
jgi:hypothetical protein